MNESISAALSSFGHRLEAARHPFRFLYEDDLHIHLPEGAYAEGWSVGGGAIVTAIVSILTGIPCAATSR